MYRLKYRKSTRNYIARLPRKIKTTIVEKLHELCENPDRTNLDIKRLASSSYFRMRIGKYRVIYTLHSDELIIEVIKVGSRGDIYRNLDKKE